MFPKPQQVQAFLGYPAMRADIVIDFSKYKPGTKIYLENILPQMDPRGPTSKLADENNPVVSGTPAYRHRVLEFRVGPRNPQFPDATINVNSSLRPNAPIAASEVTQAKSIRGDREFLADALADHRARTAAGCQRTDSGDGPDEAEGEDGAVLQQFLRHGDAPSGITDCP